MILLAFTSKNNTDIFNRITEIFGGKFLHTNLQALQVGTCSHVDVVSVYTSIAIIVVDRKNETYYRSPSFTAFRVKGTICKFFLYSKHTVHSLFSFINKTNLKAP